MDQQSSADTQVSQGMPDNKNSHKPTSVHKKKRAVIVAVVAAILVVGGAAAYLLLAKAPSHKSSDNDQQGPTNTVAFAQQYLQGCKQRNVTFTSAPVPLDQLGYMEPMGKMTDGHVTPTDHVYLSPKNSQAADNTTDVVMPADGTVIEVSAMPAQYIGDRQQQTAAEDHRLTIAHNCQYISIFIHVHKLSDALQAAVGGKMEPNTQKRVSIELKAGDKLGKIGGNPVDWSLMDASKQLSGFITPNLYQGEAWKVHVIDPVSVYTGQTKDQLIAKSLRSIEPFGGKIDYDKKGMLVGNWFKEGTNGYAGSDQSRYWDGHLSVVPDYIDPSATIVSVGNWQGKAAQFVATSTAPKPETVSKANGPVTIELLTIRYQTPDGQSWTGQGFAKGLKVSQTGDRRGVALFEVQDNEHLKVELFPNKTTAQVTGFTAAAQIYVR